MPHHSKQKHYKQDNPSPIHVIGLADSTAHTHTVLIGTALLDAADSVIYSGLTQIYGTSDGRTSYNYFCQSCPNHTKCKHNNAFIHLKMESICQFLKDSSHYEIHVSPFSLPDGRMGKRAEVYELFTHTRYLQYLATEYRIFEHLMKQPDSLIWEIDAKGLYTHLSQGISSLLGYTPQELIGIKHFHELHPKKGIEICGKSLFDIFDRQWAFRNILNRGVTKSGREFWFATNGVPLFDETGVFIGYRGVDVDVTETILMLEQHARELEQLQQSEKLESQRLLIGGVTHNFRNMLQVILSHCEAAETFTDKTTRAYHPIQQAIQACSKASNVMNRLLSNDMGQQKIFTTININKLIHDFIPLIQKSLHKNVSIQFIPGEQVPHIQGDACELEQVIMNICLNAQDAMPDGGFITIQTTVESNLKHAEANPAKLNSTHHAILSIADSGCGMNEETLSHIFEPFFSTKGKDRGIGLGMATVYRTVNEHNGFIRIESQINVGTNVIFYFPCHTE